MLDGSKLSYEKTTTNRIASEKIGTDLYRQVHMIQFVETSGVKINAITVNDASSEECSMSKVDVYVISKKTE